MTSLPSLEAILSSAEANEKRYEWINAASEYRKAVKMALDSGDLFKTATLQEAVGYCLYRGAFQGKTREEFVDRMHSATKAYQTAEASYARLGDRSPWAYRCSAVASVLRHWIASTPSEKRELMRDWLNKQELALEGFWSRGDKLEYGRTYGRLSRAFEFFFDWEENQFRRVGLDKGVEWGQRAIAALSELNSKDELAASYIELMTCFMRLRAQFITDIVEQARVYGQGQELVSKALELVDEVRDANIVARVYHQNWYHSPTASEQHIEYLEKAQQYAEAAQDLFMRVQVSATFSNLYMRDAQTTEDPEETSRKLDEYKESLDRMEPMCAILSWYGHKTSAELGFPPWGYVQYYFLRGSYEANLQKRQAFLDKALDIGTRSLHDAMDYWGDLREVNVTLPYGRAFWARSKLERDPVKRKAMLENAFTYIRDTGGAQLAQDRVQSLRWDWLGDVKAELAALEQDASTEADLLEEAASLKRKALEHYKRAEVSWASFIYRTLMYPISAAHYPQHARMLMRLHVLKKERKYLTTAVEVLQRGIEVAGKAGLASRVAECCWQLGTTHDALGDFTEAETSFKQACEAYSEASEKVPPLKDFYKDYAGYMSAWSAIEQARRSHNQKRYVEAAEGFGKASQLLKNTARWGNLSSNYSAWAMLDRAEGLSRKENYEEARDAFQKAADLFSAAKQDILIMLAGAQPGEERINAEELVKASDPRREYCLARGVLEDARVSAGQGDYLASSEKYDVAAGQFERILGGIEQDSDRRDLKPIPTLCRAWERMMQAEDRSSANLYGEASQLFEQVVQDAVDSQTSVLAQANSYMCQALEAATRFEATKDPGLFNTAKKHLDAATNQYLRAGSRPASEYSRATNRLLDAYFYLFQAQVETDPAKRVQSYQLAETMLQTSAGAYLKARHPGKADQVRRILEIAREDREIAVSLSQVLQAPITASATTAFLAPVQSREQAVGLERFENADIQANILPRDQEARLGDTIRLNIDLVNAGKGGAQLIKVTELLPQSFELVDKPDTYSIEDSSLNLKGKSLGPLRTEELSLVLKPLDKGTYQIKPRILYLDESGKYKSHEPEPATIVVKELGISGWLKGPTRDK